MSTNDREQIHALSQRILLKCAHQLGGAAMLAKHLGVPETTLADWLSGKQVPPVEIIMKAAAPLVAEQPHAGQDAPDTAVTPVSIPSRS